MFANAAVSLISAVLVALTIIDLLKPYFLIISGFTFAVAQITTLGSAGGGGGGGVINYSRCIHFKAQSVQIILFTLQIIHV